MASVSNVHIEPQCAKQEHVKCQLRFEAHKSFLNTKVLVIYNARNPSFHAVRTASTMNIFQSVIDEGLAQPEKCDSLLIPSSCDLSKQRCTKV